MVVENPPAAMSIVTNRSYLRRSFDENTEQGPFGAHLDFIANVMDFLFDSDTLFRGQTIR